MRKDLERRILEKQRKLSEDYTKEDNNDNDEDYFYDEEYDEEEDDGLKIKSKNDRLEGADHQGKHIT